ncbi:YebC/PmpR family DNA-binding transcriptional regulator [bacterium]|jgi:YebC/PmpR family DNA-binding regulatory protein|nr:YebC/PmpR family DNA-binding transcriptional regulator [bacterium]MBT3850180.1 YebC/PmpR family DNA-binding transcriptional regulator [bacterium]MDG2445809.1 YebC/PmpR family DNA-binding transcriptional regulator [Thermodesulfobacteriota bacterium]|tara:strand:- start:9568 stop:10314 length:747 start_codon:yes stop_codon:yes gene_type:complete
MSGHSKWSSIKHKKGALDAKRGKVFTKLIREITVAARDAGGDPDTNPRLRLALLNARSANMPKDTSERAIKKGTGELAGEALVEITYEGYGPGGTAVLVEVMTDNKNRTVSELRRAFSKFGGNLGESGCVSWIFQKKGKIEVASSSIQEDVLIDLALELGAEDVLVEEGFFVVLTEVEDFEDVRKGFEEKNVEIVKAEVSMIPSNSVRVEGKPAEHMLKMLDLLEDCDDVQQVHSNFDIDDSVFEALA